MSSNARRKGSPSGRSSISGVTAMRGAKTRIFVFFTLVILTAVFSANALTANQTANTQTPAAEQSGFIASSFNSILSFFGLAEEVKPATAEVQKSDDDSPDTSAKDRAATLEKLQRFGITETNANEAERPAAVGCEKLPDGLIACYRAENDTKDATGAHDGEWRGGSAFASGKVGDGSFNFGGSNKVIVANTTDLNPINLTVDGWVNVSRSVGSFAVLTKGDSAYSLQIRDGRVVFVSRNLFGDVETLESSRPVNVGKWTHIAATHDGTTRTIYIDGEAAGSDSQNGLYSGDAGELVLGAALEAERSISVYADEVKLFGRALTGEEIKEIVGQRADAVDAVLNFSVAAQTVTENAAPGPLNSVQVVINIPSGAAGSGNITVDLVPLGGIVPGGGSGCGIGNDYVGNPDPVIVPVIAGQTTASFGVSVCDDTTPEGPEQFRVDLISTTTGDTIGVTNQQTITINDNDATVTISAVAGDAASSAGPNATLEDPGLIYYTFTRTPGPTTFALPVNFTRTGTADDGNDGTPGGDDFNIFGAAQAGNTACGLTYSDTSNTGVVTIPVGSASCQIMVFPLIDSRVEPNETVILTLTPPGSNSYVIGAPDTQTGIIQNDDFAAVELGVDSGDDLEGDPGATGTFNFDFNRTVPANSQTEALTVNFSLTGTALCGGATQDYIVTVPGTDNATFNTGTCTGTVTFAAGDNDADVQITAVPDRRVENDESIQMNVLAGTNTNNGNTYGLGNDLNDAVDIDDDDEDVSVVVTNSPLSEAGPGAISFDFTRNFNSGGGVGGAADTIADTLVVNFSLAGTAACGSTADYTVTGTGADPVTYNTGTCTGTITFGPFDGGGSVLITPTNDNVPENNENVVLQVLPGDAAGDRYGVGFPNNGTNPQVAPFPANSTATGIITNDDFWVAVQVAAPSSVDEGTSPGAGGVLTYTFTRIGETADQLCANFQIDGGSGHADATTDYGVAFNPAAAGAFCTSTFFPVANANSGGFIGIPGAGAALTPASQLVTLSPVVNGVQANTATLTVTANPDNLPEPNELVRVSVVNDAFGADPKVYAPNILFQADGTIVNDDSQRVAVSVDGPVNEGNPAFPPATGPGVLTFTFTRTLAADFCDALSVNYGLSGTIDGADFTSLAALGNSNIVSFPANAAGCASATSQTVTVTVTAVQDTTPEANESAIVTVFDTADYTANGGPATGVFLNDDTTVTCTALATPISETGGSTTSTCTRSTPGSGAGNGVGQNAALAALTVVYGIGGTATNGVDYTLLSGTMTFAGTDPTATVTVTAISDALVEGDETVSLTFNSQLVGGVQGVYFDPNPTVLSTVIADDDNDVSVIVTSPASRSVFENAGTPLVVTFSRSAAGAHLANPLTVGFSVAGTACDSNTFGSPCTPSAGGGPADVDYDIVFPPGTTGTYDPETGTGTIVIPGSASSPGTASLHVVPRGDTFVEPDETVIFDVTETATIDDVGGTLAERTGTILNDDNAFSVVASPASGNEGHQNGKFLNDGVTQNTHGIVPEPSGISGGPTNTDLTPHGSHAVFVVTRTGNLSNAQTIDIGTIPTGSFGEGTATSGPQNSACGAPGVDYITDGETFTFPAVANTFGTQTFYHFVAVCGDIDVEVNETINVKLSNPTSVPGPFSTSIPSPNSGPHATYTIVNDDGQGKGGIWVRATNVKVVEPAGGGTVVANFQVCAYTSATGNTVATNVATPIYFDYITQDGTQVLPSGNQTNTSNPANAGSDYGETSSSLTDDDIAISPSTGCSPLIPVTVNSDSLVEGQENYFLRVFNVNPGAGNSFGSAIPNIANALDTRTTGTGFTSDVLSPPALIINGYNGNQPVPNAVGSVGLINETGAANSYYVTDVAQAEGNGGDNATTFIHYLRKNGTAQESQTVCWRTQNGNTAVTGGGANPALGGASATTVYDYTIVNPSNVSCHTFDSNTPDGFSLPINIVVNGDVYYEKDDTYTVELISISPNTVGSTFAANPSHPGDPNYIGKGIGTIQNDDLVPTVGLVNIGNSQRLSVENDSGTFSIPVEFSVSGPTLIPVTVNYDVTAGGAPAGSVAAVVGPDGGPCGSQTASTARDLYQPTTGSSASPVLFSSGTPISKVVAGNALSFPGQDQAGTYSINLVGCGDTRPEPDENFTVTITSAVEALVAPNGTGSSGGCSTSTSALCGNKVGIIRDTDWNGVFNFSDANGLPPVNVTLNDGDVSLAEGSTVGGTTNFDFYVRYTGRAADYEISMVLETVDGTAQDDVPSSDDNDYVPRNNLSGNRCEVTFPAGSNEPQLCRILVNNDAVQELDETFTLQVTNITTPAGAFLSTSVIGYGPGDLLNPKGRVVTFSNLGGFGTDLIAQGNILNDDGSRVVSVNARTLAEGTDAGATTAFVHRVEIQGSSNQAAVFTYQVIGPSSSLGLTAVGGMNCSGANSGSPDFINTPQLAPGSYPAGTGLVATSGTTGTLTFGPTGGTGPGFEYIDILVPVCADTRDEPNETYRVVLTAVSNVTVSTGSGNGLGTINNDDGVQYSLLTNPININEGDTVGAGQSATVTLVRSGNTSNAATFTWYTVNGPAPDPPGLGTGAVGGSSCNTGSPQTGDPDFISQGSAGSPLNGPGYSAGQTGNRTVQVPICGDTVQEGNQSFTVVITPSDGAPLTATVNIIEESTDQAPPPPAGIEGDVVDGSGGAAGDGLVAANDVSALRAALLAGTQPFAVGPGSSQFSRADINNPCGNGGLDVGDLAYMRQLALSLATPLAVCGPLVPTAADPVEEGNRAENVRVIRVVNSKVAITPGTPPPATVTFPIEMVSTGIETGASFSISWDVTKFTYNTSAVGNGVPGDTQFDPITTQTGQGRLGMFINSPNSFVAGTRQLATVTLNVLPSVTAGTYPVTFGGQPTAIFVSGVNGADVTSTTTFEPGNIVVNTTAAGVRISGRVTNAGGQGIRNAVVVMTDAEGNRRTATTGSFGIYTFEDVEVGSSYVIGVEAKRYRFASRVLNVNDSLTDVNFVGQE